MQKIWRKMSARTHSKRKLVDFLTGAAGFLVVALLATTGIVEGTSGSALAGPGGSYFAQGDIVGANPASDQVAGITEAEFANTDCSYPPESQGADGWVFQLPEDFAVPAPFTVTGVSEAPEYDLDVYFFTAACARNGSVATTSVDESGELPAGTRFVVVDQWVGANTTATLCAGDPAGCVEGSSSSPPGSSSPPSTTEPPPPIQGDQRVSIQTDSSMTRFMERFVLSGFVEGDVECGPPHSHRVGVSKRVGGQKEYKSVNRSIPVRQNGKWTLSHKSAKSAKYRATVSPSVACPASSTGPLTISVRVKMGPLEIPRKEGCGPLRVEGRTTPKYPGTTVKLQRHTEKGKWKGLGESSRVNKKGKYNLKAPECGLYRAIWPKQAPSNAWGFAKFRHRQG